MSMHWNVKCEGCNRTHLIHHRYKCLRCANYDLCAMCYENKVETGCHSKEHPFQCLLDRAARELFFDGEKIPDLCADSFTCPFCGKMGHAVKELVKHVQAKHRGDSTPVICPLCIATPSMDTVRMNNLVSHVSLIHSTGILRIGGGAGNNQARTTDFNIPTFGHRHVRRNSSSVSLRRSRSPPPQPLAMRSGYGGFQWPPNGNNLGISAFQEGFNPNELSSLSGSMHTMRDNDMALSVISEQQQHPQQQQQQQDQQQNLQQFRRSQPLSVLYEENTSQLLNPEEAQHAFEEDLTDPETEEMTGNEPTSSM